MKDVWSNIKSTNLYKFCFIGCRFSYQVLGIIFAEFLQSFAFLQATYSQDPWPKAMSIVILTAMFPSPGGARAALTRCSKDRKISKWSDFSWKNNGSIEGFSEDVDRCG